jgi:hypothetical protein
MVESSKSAPGQFAAAVKKADTRTRAATIVSPQATPADSAHGHEGEPPEAATWPERLAVGRPRNADGSERAD